MSGQIFSPSAWSEHAAYYPSQMTLGIFDAFLPVILFPMLDHALQACPDGDKVVLLDAACGTGTELGLLIDRYGPDGEKAELGNKLDVVAVDFAQGMVDEVNKMLVDKGELGGKYRAEVQDVQHLNLPSESVSFALLLFGPMLIPDIGAAMNEFRRVLKLGGVALLSTWQSQDMYDLIDEAKASIFSLRGTGETAPSVYDAPFLGPWTKLEHVKATLSAAGLGDVQGKAVQATFMPPKKSAEEMYKMLSTNPATDAVLVGLREAEMGAFKQAQAQATKEKFGGSPPRFGMVANVAWAKKV